MMGDWGKKAPYDMVSRPSSGVKNSPKGSRAIPMGKRPKLIRIKGQAERGMARKRDKRKTAKWVQDCQGWG